MAVNCPFPGCDYTIPGETNPAIAPVLLSTHALIHRTARAKPAPVKRPEISSGGTTEGWTYFLQRWRSYVQAVQLTDADIPVQLLECCDSKLRRDVTRNSIGPLPIAESTEVDLLAAIRSLAVREENPKVARVALSRMTQDRGEPIRAFAARLRGQAEVCRFTKKCPGCDRISNQGEERVADQLCVGLADAEIQEDLLKHPDQSMSVEDTIKFVEVRAAGKRSALTMSTPTSTSSIEYEDGDSAAITSAYRKQQRRPAPRPAQGPSKATPSRPRANPTSSANPTSQQRSTNGNPTQRATPARGNNHQGRPATNGRGPCAYCGQHGHGEQERTAHRRIHCPAFGTTCSTCGKLNHLAHMCWQQVEHESAVSEQIHAMHEGTLKHQTWDQASHTWSQRRSPPQPNITVTISAREEDFRAHGHTLARETHHLTTTAMADTGCQSCLAGPSLMSSLHLSENELIPVSLVMHSASGTNLPILGAALLRIRAQPTGIETRQMVYFSNMATKLYLSLATCADLGLIPKEFPFSTPMPPQGDGQTSGATPGLHQAIPPPVQRTAALQTRPPLLGPPSRTPTRTPTPPTGTTPEPPIIADKVSTPRQAPPTMPTTPCSCPKRAPPPPRPTTLPYPATAANRQLLERHLLDLYSASAFNVCEHQPLPMMAGPPLSLSIDPTAVPKPCHTPTSIPIHWQDEVKAGLDRDVRLGVLEQVPLGTPDTWCHRMVICTKKNGSLRRTINFQQLNQHATRETHHCQSPFHQARAVPGNTKKTVFDAWNGYHSVALAESDRHFTTFITPWGRYRYRTAPQGYIASGDAYTARYDALVAHIPCKTKCIDDALLWSADIEAAFHQATEWLDVCAKNGITLNPRKFRFAQDEVEFAGFDITPTDVKPSRKYLDAISEFPTPLGTTDVRAWFGLVNQVAYAFSMASVMQPFRDLLKPSIPFAWTDQLQQAFTASKSEICQRIKEGVRIFDKNRPTCLATDWSKDGIGYWLFQKHCQCPSRDILCCQEGWKVVLVGSRFTHPAESRYAPVEGEALAVADALDKARHFVLGCSDLQIAVDHKPLLKLFGDRSLEDISNTRLRNLKEKTLRYRFRMVYIPGVRNHTSDALSRHPSGIRQPARLELQDDHHSSAATCLPASPTPTSRVDDISIHSSPNDDDGLATALCAAVLDAPITWEDLQIATAADTNLRNLSDVIEDGPPDARHHLPAGIRDYFPFIHDLSSVNGVICRGERIVIPAQLRQTCLNALHAAHQGTSGMTARAQTSLFWPGISKDIAETRSKCTVCNSNAPSQPAMPSTMPADPEYPFQHICADYFHHEGVSYLVLVDRYSNWPIVTHSSNGANGLIATLRETFSTYGIPDTLTSDGGPEFSAHSTRDFLKSWSVHHRVASAYNPHGNCRAEVAVKSTKRLIAGNTGPGGALSNQFHRALLQYRNGPSPDTGMSPANCLFGRATRDLLPGIPAKYRPHQNWTDRLDLRERALSKKRITGRARWDEHSQGLSPLRCGDAVMIQNQTGRHPTKWDKSGTVVEVLQYHQYAVRTDGSGRLTTRNRRYLRRYNPHSSPPTPTAHPLPYDSYTAPQPHLDVDPTPTTMTIHSGAPSPTHGPTPPRPTLDTAPTLPQPTPRPPPTQPAPTPPTLKAQPSTSGNATKSYAAVAKTPARPVNPTKTNLSGRFSSKAPLLPTPTKPPSPAAPRSPEATPPHRRSKRGPKPIDRYGQ